MLHKELGWRVFTIGQDFLVVEAWFLLPRLVQQVSCGELKDQFFVATRISVTIRGDERFQALERPLFSG